jgi:hypothetical protein
MKKEIILIFLILTLSGCIYVTPQSTPTNVKSFNSTDQLSEADVQQSKIVEQFILKQNFPKEFVLKGIENFYDKQLDFIAASTSAMQVFDNSLEFPFILSTSGALRLDSKDATLIEFLEKRVKNYGFKAYYASGENKQKVTSLYNKLNIKEERLNQQDPFPFIRLLVYSEAPPIVVLDRYHIFTEQDKRYNAEEKLLEQEHEQIFALAVGYRDNKVSIHDPTYEGLKASYQDIDLIDFYKAWNSDYNEYGKMFSFFLVRNSASIFDKEAIEIIKEDIKSSHDNIKTSKNLNTLAKQGYFTRKILADYIQDKKLALKLRTISRAYEALVDKKDLNTVDFKDIIDSEKVIVEKLK